MDGSKVHSKDSRCEKVIWLLVPFRFVHEPGQKVSLELNRYQPMVTLRLDEPVFRNRRPFLLFHFAGMKSAERGTSNHHACIWAP